MVIVPVCREIGIVRSSPLQPGLHPLQVIAVRDEPRPVIAFERQRSLERQVQPLVDAALDVPDGDRTVAGDFTGDDQRVRQQLLRRRDSLHQAEVERLVRR